MTVVREDIYDYRFHAAYILELTPTHHLGHYWIPSSLGSFVLDLGCEKLVNNLQLINSRNQFLGNDRATKDFEFSSSLRKDDGWEVVIASQLPDRRRDNEPTAMDWYYFPPVNMRFVKFEVKSFHRPGRGGGLKYINFNNVPGKIKYPVTKKMIFSIIKVCLPSKLKDLKILP